MKLRFLCNLPGELLQMHQKCGGKSLVAKGIDLGWVFLSQVQWIDSFCLGSKIGEQVQLWFLCNLGRELSQMHKK